MGVDMADKYGIRVALPEYNTKEATPEQCSVTPEYLCPKIKLNQKPAHFGVYSHTFASQPAQGETILFQWNMDLLENQCTYV
jgi:hypothetical protein